MRPLPQPYGETTSVVLPVPTLEVDVGDADETEALTLLVRMLEGYHQAVYPVEAVELASWKQSPGDTHDE